MKTRIISQPKLIFWDFDGVIKDSVDVKTQAFVKMFQVFGDGVAERVRKHHEAHGGMSRLDKFPLYLQWAGEESSQTKIDEYCDQFAQMVLQNVIDAPWVGGVEDIIRSNYYRQIFILVSATPQKELEQILEALNLKECFSHIYGAPTDKKEAIRMTLADHGSNPEECIMIGDAMADLEAAQANRVPFLLRKHATNLAVFADYTGFSIKDFTELLHKTRKY